MQDVRNLTSHQQELLRDLDEQKLFDIFLADAERKIFNEFKNGDRTVREIAGPKIDALQALGASIQSAINEAILSGRHNDIRDTEQE